MSDLEKRIRELEDAREVTNLVYRYAHYIDAFRRDDWLDLFTPDAEYIARGRTGPNDAWENAVHLKTRTDFEKFIDDFSVRMRRPAGEEQKNLLSQPLVEVSGDTATATTYFHLIFVKNGERYIFAGGRYIDRAVRCDDGRWRFRERISDIDSRSEL